MLANMGLAKALEHTKSELWVQALKKYLQQKWEILDAEPEVKEAMLNRFGRAFEDLTVVAEFLKGEEPSLY